MAADDSGLFRVLQACADVAPAPLFPTQLTDMDRAALDAALDRLRLAGLVEIADWVQGKGQGYVLTPAGAVSLQRGRIIPAAAPEEQPDPATTTWQRGEQARSAAFGSGSPVVTLTLIFINLAVFGAGIALAWQHGQRLDDYIIRGKNPVLFAQGDLDTQHIIRERELWRLLSYQFVHANLLHLALNMLALFNLGVRLESMWGSKRFLVLYLISGVVGGCAVIMTQRGAVGASGSICGLLTSFAVWLWLHRAHFDEELVRSWTKTIGFNLLLVAWISIGFPSISWEGHLGGAVGGAAVSLPLYWLGLDRCRWRLLGLLGVVAVPAVALSVALAPHWQQMLAQGRYRTDLLELEGWLIAQHNQHAVPLMRLGLAKPGEQLAAQQACAEAEARLNPMIDRLQAETPQDESQLAHEMGQTTRYLETWRDFFQTLKRHLDEPLGWDARGRELEELDKKRQLILDLSLPLRHHTIMPALHPVEKSPPDPA